MSKGDVLEHELLNAILCGKAITGISATAGTTNTWVGLHTADPTDSGSTGAEGGYAAYARVAVARSTTGWAVTSGTSNAVASASPVANIDFPQNTAATTGTFTHFSIFASSAATSTACWYIGTVTPNINFGNGVTPRLTTGTSITET